MDRITHGVSSFRMSTEEDDGAKSESDDDTSETAVYKRSRLRTVSPAPARSDVDSDVDELEDDHSTTERMESIPEDEEEDRKPNVVALSPEAEAEQPARPPIPLASKRLAVIQALIARANQLYREQLARKVHQLPALQRIKEEEID
jgi:hypothetical protein